MARKKAQTKADKILEEVVEEIKETPVEEVKAESEDVAAVIKPKKESKTTRYWKRPVFFAEYGTITGLVTKKHLDAFMKTSPKSDINDWTLDYDPEAKRQEEAKRKMRERIGLK